MQRLPTGVVSVSDSSREEELYHASRDSRVALVEQLEMGGFKEKEEGASSINSSDTRLLDYRGDDGIIYYYCIELGRHRAVALSGRDRDWQGP